MLVLGLVVALVLALVVAGVPDTLAVSVMLVAVAVAVMLVGRPRADCPGGHGRLVIVVIIVILAGRLRLLADAGLGRRGDAAAARTGGGRDSRATRGSDGAAELRWRRWAVRPGWARGGRRPRSVAARGCPARHDDEGDLTRSGRRSRDRGLVTGLIEKPGRGQNEPNRR